MLYTKDNVEVLDRTPRVTQVLIKVQVLDRRPFALITPVSSSGGSTRPANGQMYPRGRE